jgi:predicted NBD/HSP70 family sugar kinase
MRSASDQSRLAARVILEVRSRRATSRRMIADMLRISPTTAGQYVDHLIGQGYLRETGLDRGAKGRPKRTLNVRAVAGWFAGVEFNAARARAMAIDFTGARLDSVATAMPQAPSVDRVIGLLTQLVERLAGGRTRPLLGIGVGAPGIVHSDTGVVSDYAFLPNWQNIPLGEAMRRHFGIPVSLHNNLRVIALAERWLGAGAGLENYVILGPRSGFGVAIVQNGSLVTGAHHAAGEIGHWPWPDAGSTTTIHEHLTAAQAWRRLGGQGGAPADLRPALAGLGAEHSPAWRELAADFASLIIRLQWLLDTGAYLLHGPLTELGPAFCEAIMDEMRCQSPAMAANLPLVTPSTLADDAGAIGAACLAMESWLPE